MKSYLALLCLAAATVGCGDSSDSNNATDARGVDGTSSDGPTSDSGTVSDASAGSFTLTSADIAEGDIISNDHTCYGSNTSPPFAWTDPPTTPQGFVLILTDKNNSLVHSAMWDIPGLYRNLPAGIERITPLQDGTQQSNAYDGDPGYAGPCPQQKHTYEFTLFAVSENPVTGVDAESSAAEIRDRAEAVAIATATLSFEFDPPN